MAFYSLVPFEGSVWLIRADESKPLTEDQLKTIDDELQKGKTLVDIQDILEDAWIK